MPEDASVHNVRAAHVRLDNLADHLRVNDRMLRGAMKVLASHETRLRTMELRMKACIDRVDKLNGSRAR